VKLLGLHIDTFLAEKTCNQNVVSLSTNYCMIEVDK
jgi:hypothetical protein